MRGSVKVAGVMAIAMMTIGTTGVSAQGATANLIPCKDTACVLVLDWGNGKTSASYPPDPRYGSGDEFEQRFRSALVARGYRIVDSPVPGALTMTVRPTMRSRVMCDAMAGVNTNMSCTAMTALAINYTSSDPGLKAPGAIRLSNRCAAGDVFMLNRAFAQYASDMVWFQHEGQAAKADRPSVNC